jgi:hypothetical protein
MSEPSETIYVELIGEAVDVWRPVQAKHFRGDIYLIVSQPYDRETETWRFGPRSAVVCERVESEGASILRATEAWKRKGPVTFVALPSQFGWRWVLSAFVVLVVLMLVLRAL